MIKLGVTTRDQAERILPKELAHKGWWPFAFTLLEELEEKYCEQDSALLERIYKGLAAGENVWKITKPNRFEELDEVVNARICQRFDKAQKLVVHDMAASNAVTSLEWYIQLSSLRDVCFRASDYYDHLTIVALPASRWTIVFDVDGRPLQYVGGRFVLSGYRHELWRFPANRLVQAYVRRRIIPEAIDCLNQSDGRADKLDQASGIRHLRLFHPRCIQQARSDGDFHLERHDLFKSDSQPSHVVRVMNALTPHHFSEDQLLCGIRCATKRLHIGGLFVIGRSIDEEDGRPAATVYERSESGLVPVCNVNEGSELKAVIDRSAFSFDEMVSD